MLSRPATHRPARAPGRRSADPGSGRGTRGVKTGSADSDTRAPPCDDEASKHGVQVGSLGQGKDEASKHTGSADSDTQARGASPPPCDEASKHEASNGSLKRRGGGFPCKQRLPCLAPQSRGRLRLSAAHGCGALDVRACSRCRAADEDCPHGYAVESGATS